MQSSGSAGQRPHAWAGQRVQRNAQASEHGHPFKKQALPHLCPHLFHILQDHVAMPVKCLDASQQLPVVAAVDQHLQRQAEMWFSAKQTEPLVMGTGTSDEQGF